jgi:hypothetical protein
MISKMIQVTEAEVHSLYVNSRGTITNMADVLLAVLVKHGHTIEYDDVDDMLFMNLSNEKFSTLLNASLLGLLPNIDKRTYTKKAKAGLSKVHYTFDGEIKGIPRAIRDAYNVNLNPSVPMAMTEALELTVTMSNREKSKIASACMYIVLNGSLYE